MKDIEQIDVSAIKDKIQFYSSLDKNLTLEEFMPDQIMSDSTKIGMVKLIENGFRKGFTSYTLINIPGFSITYAWFKSGFQLPVHSHNADCLYYIVAGQAILGNKTFNAGDGFFVPKETYYSYKAGSEGIEIIEFRHANQINMVYRDSKPEYWKRLAAIFAERSQYWDEEQPPSRNSTGRG